MEKEALNIKQIENLCEILGLVIVEGDINKLSGQTNYSIRVENSNYVGKLNFIDFAMIDNYINYKNKESWVITDKDMEEAINLVLTRKALFQVGSFQLVRC